MCDHEYYLISKLLFSCSKCKATHQCGLNCDSICYNGDKTQVCLISGLCFEQKICDLYGNVDGPDLEFHPKLKKDQQIKNSNLKSNMIFDILHNEVFPKCDMFVTTEIEKQLKQLWVEYVNCIKEKNMYIHRKDSTSFVVGILFSLNNGIKSYDGQDYIVYPHPLFVTNELNKKKKYKNFEVSSITYGIKKIKQVFSAYKVENVISIERFL